MAEAYLGGHTVISLRRNPSWFSHGVAGSAGRKVRIRRKRLRTKKARTAAEAAAWRSPHAWAIADLAAKKEERLRKAQVRSAAKAVRKAAAKAAAAAAARIEAARARAKRQAAKAEAERQRQAAKAGDDRTWRFRLTKRPDGTPTLVSLSEVPP
jgi:hypothetical protein